MVKKVYQPTFNLGKKKKKKKRPGVVANATTSALQVTAADGTTLSNLGIANAVIDSDAVNRTQLDGNVQYINKCIQYYTRFRW